MAGKNKEVTPKEKCVFSGCYDDAVWKGTATAKSIAQVDKENRNKHLFTPGVWFYCQKHRNIVKGYCPHLKFEAI